MHSVRVRTPYEVKVYGDPDKPFVIEWDYPLFIKGRFGGSQRRHQLASAEKALQFTLKHEIPLDRLPIAMRKKLCAYARTVSTIASTSTARCTRSSALDAERSCPGR